MKNLIAFWSFIRVTVMCLNISEMVVGSLLILLLLATGSYASPFSLMWQNPDGYMNIQIKLGTPGNNT